MEVILIIFTAISITALATPLTIKLANKFGLIDDPLSRPHPAHIHQKVIPRAGGLAIYIGIIITSLLFLSLQKYLFGIFGGITLLLVIGLLDDKWIRFSPYIRLFLLFIAAGFAVGSGIGIAFISNPLSFISPFFNITSGSIIRLDQIVIPFNFLGPHTIIPLADIFALFWIVSLTQIINWSKGVDGQMPGITFVTAIILGLLSLKFFSQGDLNQLSVAKLAFIVAGTSLGFLIFNWHPAKIIPGFSGSTILAFMLAVLAILSGAKIATAVLVLGIPTADFIYTFLRRLSQGKSPVWPDREHLHHRLLNLGWTPAQISLFYILGSAILGAVALVGDTQSKIFVAAVVATMFFGFILWINSFGDLSRLPGQDNG